jgi:hypothetical protein
VDGHAARPAGGKRLAPARLLDDEVEDREMARMLGEQGPAQLDGIPVGS